MCFLVKGPVSGAWLRLSVLQGEQRQEGDEAEGRVGVFVLVGVSALPKQVMLAFQLLGQFLQ